MNAINEVLFLADFVGNAIKEGLFHLKLIYQSRKAKLVTSPFFNIRLKQYNFYFLRRFKNASTTRPEPGSRRVAGSGTGGISTDTLSSKATTMKPPIRLAAAKSAG